MSDELIMCLRFMSEGEDGFERDKLDEAITLIERLQAKIVRLRQLDECATASVRERDTLISQLQAKIERLRGLLRKIKQRALPEGHLTHENTGIVMNPYWLKRITEALEQKGGEAK